MSANTLFLRLEGPLQAWGNHESKFVVRRTWEAPTKSGVIGMLCAALGVPRQQATDTWLPRLRELQLGVRIDRPGVRWWDYHTVGAGMKMRTADGGSKDGPILTRREYLCDASFLVALQGDPELIAALEAAMQAPHWTPYLGRKCCPPSRPLLEKPSSGAYPNLLAALQAVPWRPRPEADEVRNEVNCLLEWRSSPEQAEAPEEALIWYDVPVSLEPPAHHPRFVVRAQIQVGDLEWGESLPWMSKNKLRPPPRPRADYGNMKYKEARKLRLAADYGLCVFCKSPATTVQHVTYRRAGGQEVPEDLRSLCRLCHDAVTMLEYGYGMGLDRINPEDQRWRVQITRKRQEIISFRSLETRRRRLQPEEVE
jgi:CRISPR system Cascade subunit CasD